MCITRSSAKTQYLENLNSVVRRIADIYETVFVDDDAVKVAELARPVSGTAPHELEIEVLVEDLNAVVARSAISTFPTWSAIPVGCPIITSFIDELVCDIHRR